MPTPAERKALLFLAAVVALGAGVRGVRALSGHAPDPDSAESVREQLRRVDSARSAGRGDSGPRGPKKKRALSLPPGQIDMDTSSAELIEKLNGIGPALAKRIVADRDSFGSFGSMDGLSRVRGIGPVLAARLGPQVTFSRLPRPQNAVTSPPPTRGKVTRKGLQSRSFP